MGFVGVYKAIYDYAPQAEGELEISEGDIVYVLEKSTEDDWWKVKKKASEEEEDEPVGLVPNNYVEEAPSLGHARALFEYTRQTDEELSFPEDAQLEVFDTSDPDWILVGHDGDYGFVPSNYIEMGDGDGQAAEEEEEEEPSSAAPALPVRPPTEPASPPLPTRPVAAESSSPSTPSGPAAAIASIMAGRSASSRQTPAAVAIPPPRPQYTSEDSEDDAKSPPLPTRPRGESIASAEQSYRSPQHDEAPESPQTAKLSPGGFHMYNINEMVSIMGKRKKMPTTLGINLKTGAILVAPERTSDGPSKEWSADKMTHYSREGKHVFMELVRPSKSYDFHAGAKDTAEEIVSALGEMAGTVRAAGLKEVIMAGSGHGQKKGQVLYDFKAQGADEVSVDVGDEVIITDDTTSEEWWQVRRLKNGKEGVVPSSYVEVTGSVASPTSSSHTGINAGRSTVEQNRLDEERLTKEAVKAAQLAEHSERSKRASEVGPGVPLPERSSSLSARDGNNRVGQQRSRRENGRPEESGSSRPSKSKPDHSKVRTWTDRSKSFSVEAQFLGLKDGKINLHKMNGVKIAVPVSKMSMADLEYVERITGISLSNDKPHSGSRKKSGGGESSSRSNPPSSNIGASVEQPKKPGYDWFEFFLSCEVAVGLCERYAQAFARDSMDESVLPDVDASILRNLGLREGDIIKVMRFLDNKYGRTKKSAGGDEGDAAGGLFSGPGGTLRNNTRKGRPAPAVQTNDVVDAKAFSQQKNGDKSSPSTATPSSGGAPLGKTASGFDDDAWDVKPSKAQAAQPSPASAEPAPAPKQVPQLTAGMQDISMLTQPLEPTKVQPTATPPAITAATPPQPVQPPVQAQVAQPTGATPAFFSGMPPPGQQQQIAQLPQNIARQRPMPPQHTMGQGALMPPPPTRPLSAPQSAQPSAFTPPPLQPQMTGNPSMYQTQIAPPGQSLQEINQARMQQQYAQQMQSMMPQPTGMMMPMQTGFGQGQFMQQQQPMMNGQMQSPFADPRPMMPQPTGYPGPGFNPAVAGVNAYLPPALEPQRTGMPPLMQQQPMAPQPTGMGFAQGFGNAGMVPQQQQQQQQQPIQPLLPQKTGPPPPVRFGVTGDAKKLMPQATGRKANLAQATPQNPFGF